MQQSSWETSLLWPLWRPLCQPWHRTLTLHLTTFALSRTSRQARTEGLPLYSYLLLWYGVIWYVCIYKYKLFQKLILLKEIKCSEFYTYFFSAWLSFSIAFNTIITGFLQEASQLLTILQGLQPPLKLDGKTIGVDYAKSARKWV